jgi:hypothetical protein
MDVILMPCARRLGMAICNITVYTRKQGQVDKTTH